MLCPLVGFMLFSSAIMGYQRDTNFGLLLVVQGLSLIALILVGMNAFEDLKHNHKQD